MQENGKIATDLLIALLKHGFGSRTCYYPIFVCNRQIQQRITHRTANKKRLHAKLQRKRNDLHAGHIPRLKSAVHLILLLHKFPGLQTCQKGDPAIPCLNSTE